MATGLIPENVLEEILSRVDIVEVISGYLPLKRAGRNFRAVCPFHHEKTASFMVSPDRQIYHCFGCHAGGNAFKFLMQYERLEFPEAVEALAKKAGVQLPETKKQDEATSNLITQIYKINELSALFYANNMDSSEASQAKNYLLKRGVKEQTLKSLKLGFAPDKWDSLIAYLRSKGATLAGVEKAGLVLSKDSGGYYDRFRNRIIFPIFDIKSRPLAFGARVLDKSLPKYVNSPETPVYTKGKNLYGLNLSRDSIREQDCAVIVEGYLDFIMPYQEGLTNIVASQGTALTLDQIRLLKRYTHNAVIVYDGDSAGEMATLRSFDIFIDEDVSVRVVSLPQGYDPDLFVRKFGVEKLKDMVKESHSLFDYKLKIMKSRFNADEAEGKAKIASGMLSTVSKFKDAVLKSEYVKRLAQDLDVKEEALLEELRKIKEPAKAMANPAQPEIKSAINISPAEKLLINLMLEEAQVIRRVKESLAPADFGDERVSKIVSFLFDFSEQGKSVEPSVLMDRFKEEGISLLIRESAFLDAPLENKEKAVEDCIERLKSERLRIKRQNLHNDIKAAQHQGDENLLRILVQEFHQLIKQGDGK